MTVLERAAAIWLVLIALAGAFLFVATAIRDRRGLVRAQAWIKANPGKRWPPIPGPIPPPPPPPGPPPVPHVRLTQGLAPGWHPAAEPPPDGTWCWVYDGELFVAVRDHVAAGGWSNSDTWEDFDHAVRWWWPIERPDVTLPGAP